MKYFNGDFELSEWQIINDELRSNSIYHCDGEEEVRLFNDNNAGRELLAIYNLGKLIASCSNDAYKILRDSSGVFIKATPGKIAKTFDEMKGVKSDYQKLYICDDYIEAVLEAMLRHRFYSFAQLDILKGEVNEEHAKAINALVDDIRNVLLSYIVQQRFNNKFKNAYKNYQSALDYTGALFERYSRLCVVRIDCDYKRYQNGNMVSLDEVLHDIKALLAATKTHAIFKNYVGHIGKMQFGEEAGYHFHLFFYFDGSKEIDDVGLGDLIGEFWKNEITAGQGIFENCNRKKYQKYGEKCGIGMVHFNDLKRRVNLEYAIGYIVKPWQFVLAKLKSRSRLFFRGQLPRSKKSNAGRPRATLAHVAG